MRPGGIVLERTFAEALGVGVGDRVTLNGRAFRVVGIAVTAAGLPYPNLCYYPGGGCVFDLPGPFTATDIGFAWVTEPDARSLASARAPLYYFLNLKLKDPATAPAFASRYGSGPNSPVLIPWQAIQTGSGLLVQDEQSVLSPAAWLTALLAIACVTVLAGGRMAERIRRVGLLKAVGGSPETIAVVLLAENLVLAVVAAAAGLAIGWLTAPLVASPGAALVGTARRSGAHPVHRRPGAGRRSGGSAGRDARARHPRRPGQHGQRAGRRGMAAAAQAVADRAVRPAPGAAAARAAAGGPQAAPGPAEPGQRRGHHHRHRRGAGLPHHRPPEYRRSCRTGWAIRCSTGTSRY